MRIVGLVDEDIVNYKKASMYIAFPYCSFKCEKDCGEKMCQNSALIKHSIVEMSPEEICNRYLNNPITSAIVCAGLEPFDSRFDILTLIECLRHKNQCDDDLVIYTGYTEEELSDPINNEINFLYENLKSYKNIIVKFGRFVPYQEPHYDEVLGVKLASDNQYARKIS